MSQASVLEFIEVAKQDRALRTQLEAANSSQELKAIAADRGYDLAEKDIMNVFQQQGLLVVREEHLLTDEELESVAGGKGPWTVSAKFKYDGGFGGEIGVSFSF